MNRRTILAILAATLLLASTLPAAAAPATPISDDALAGRIDVYLTRFVEQGAFSGAVLVAREGTIVLSKGYGLANEAQGTPNTPETVFQIASLTKAFTAMAVVQLVEAGRLDLDDPINRFLPNLPHDAAGGVPITVRHLLTHTSGIPDFVRDLDLRRAVSLYGSRDELVRTIAAYPLDFTPGTGFHYSNSGYILLGLIVERLSGQSYEAYLRQQILDPLGMDHTWLEQPTDPTASIAVGYVDIGDNTLIGVSTFGRVDIAYAAGGLSSTVGDLYRWDRALYTDRLASPDAIARMYEPDGSSYGLGWNTWVDEGHEAVGHDGETIGYTSAIRRFLAHDAVIIILSNRQDAPTRIITHGLTAILFG